MSRNLELGPIELLLLEYAYEDWFALFEIRGHLDEAGTEGVDARRHAFVAGLKRLIAEGLIEVAVRPDPFTIPGPPVAEPDANALISANENWANPQPGKPVVTFVATEFGRRFFERHGEGA
jgi:hypothetical protein